MQDWYAGNENTQCDVLELTELRPQLGDTLAKLLCAGYVMANLLGSDIRFCSCVKSSLAMISGPVMNLWACTFLVKFLFRVMLIWEEGLGVRCRDWCDCSFHFTSGPCYACVLQC